jgi:hypothetical protein
MEDPRKQISRVICPLCGVDSPTVLGNKLFSVVTCPVCNHQWSQIFRVDHLRAGEPKFWSYTKSAHPNIRLYNHHLMMDMQLSVDYFWKKYQKDNYDKCAWHDCKNMIDSVELLLHQCLEDGFPSNRNKLPNGEPVPFLCKNHFEAYLVRKRKG